MGCARWRRTIACRRACDMDYIIYGAGFFGLHLCELFQRQGITPRYIFDRDVAKWHQRWEGVEIVPPDPAIAGSSKVVIAHASPTVMKGIGGDLRGMGIQNTETVYEFANRPENAALFLGQRVILRVEEREIDEHREYIQEVEALFADEDSKATYRDILRALREKSFTGIASLPMEQQYLFYEVLPKRADEVFVDVGAGPLGEVWKAFAAENGEAFRFFYLFDPCRTLATALPTDPSGKVVIVPKAAGEKCGRVRVKNYRDSNALICPVGEETAACVPLDDFPFAAKPTFLKIDTEGDERQVLRGARHLIAEGRPVIACAVYHQVRDFWELPLWLAKLPDYRLYLRSYLGVHETVLYLIPKERLTCDI